MNNSSFRKCMEDVRRRRDTCLCCSTEVAEELISKRNFLDRTIFSSSLAAIHLQKTEFNSKTITIGMAVLDISKILMHSFFYDFMRPSYEENFKMLYTDTDSFIFHINTQNVYGDMKRNIEKFDTPDYSETNEYKCPA